jgi:hypothetical protein
MPLKSLPRQMVLNYFFLVRRELDFFALFTFGLSFSGLGDVLNAPFSAASKRARASFSEYSSCFLGVETMTTALVRRPKHVRAIGILSIEIAHMERALSDLFRAITDIHFLVAESIFFTSNSSIARMDIISNVAPLVLTQFPAKIKRINRLIARAKSAMGKRHDIIHAFWFLDEKGEDIRAEKLGAFRYKTYTLQQLESQIEDIRSLTEDISQFCAQFREDHPGPASTGGSLREYWSQ